jgi:hypothetical protein
MKYFKPNRRKETRILQLVLAGIILLGSWNAAWAQNQGLVECDLPPMDIPGKDLPDFPRFPGSIRFQYTKDSELFSFVESKRLKGEVTKYLSTSDMKTLMEFYSNKVVEKGWKIIASQYLDSSKATLTLEKKQNRIMLVLEPKMESDPNQANTKGRPSLLRSKCYQILVFLYNITEQQ